MVLTWRHKELQYGGTFRQVLGVVLGEWRGCV